MNSARGQARIRSSSPLSSGSEAMSAPSDTGPASRGDLTASATAWNQPPLLAGETSVSSGSSVWMSSSRTMRPGALACSSPWLATMARLAWLRA